MNESNINRIVGGSENEKIKKEEYFIKNFENQDFLKSMEIEKKPGVIELIDKASEATAKIADYYGAEKIIDIPIQNVHIFENTEFEKVFAVLNAANPHGVDARGAQGFYDTEAQAIFLRNKGRLLDLLYALIHEELHFRSYHSIEIKKSKTIERRSGWGINLKEGNPANDAFHDLNEAVIDTLALNALPSVIEDLAGAISKKEADEMKKQYENEEESFNYASYGYEKIRLNDIIDKIFQKNPDDFKNKDEVFEIFTRATFSGNLIPAARIIEKTFGKGSFRKFGEEGMPVSQIEKDFGLEERAA